MRVRLIGVTLACTTESKSGTAYINGICNPAIVCEARGSKGVVYDSSQSTKPKADKTAFREYCAFLGIRRVSIIFLGWNIII